jgi:hypothetical protein
MVLLLKMLLKFNMHPEILAQRVALNRKAQSVLAAIGCG